MACNLRFINASYFEMDGKSSVDWMSSKKLPPLFYLYVQCKFIGLKMLSLTLFKIIIRGHPLWGHQDVPLLRRISGGDAWSPCKPKSLNFPILLDITLTKKLSPPVPWSKTSYWKQKVSLIVFRQILSKILLEAFIFSNTIMIYLKKLVGTKSLNTKHCPTGLSPRIIPHYAKNLLIYPTRKISHNKFTSFAIKCVIPSPSNRNLHLVTCNSHCCCIII